MLQPVFVTQFTRQIQLLRPVKDAPLSFAWIMTKLSLAGARDNHRNRTQIRRSAETNLFF
ncbi:hypothetical protein NSMM_480104 [Nitrosomonas mobilis]|uniref:Uncharacterized protein n=1 Tax=Nitrosomonas mobilis TaxID=51642 RepID=A0A1G5SG63_9PROT|nr:hypothetical protein NSMM_480104 [Nitrosomonas mobilis]